MATDKDKIEAAATMLDEMDGIFTFMAASRARFVSDGYTDEEARSLVVSIVKTISNQARDQNSED